MIDKYHEPILAFITEKNRAVGVNEIANATGIALSTVQKYLTTQQKYFRKTETRKWDLPERVTIDVTENAVQSAVGVLENTISLFQSQLDEIKTAAENMHVPLSTLKRITISHAKPSNHPVAEVSINPEFAVLDERIEQMKEGIESNINIAPPMYRELLSNTNWHSLVIKKGTDYLNQNVMPEITKLLMVQIKSLSDEVVRTLEEYQK